VIVLRILYRLFQVYLFFVRPLPLGVRIMLIRDGKVLLVRQTYMDGWFMPGGRIEKNETTEQAARREAREEVGAELRSISLLGVYSNFKEWKSDHNVLFLSEDFELAGGHDREIAELRFFPLDALPPDVWPGHCRRLLEYRDLAQHRVSDFVRFGEW
jgi:8-oxo-dGTP pyrophosphatase MutT (NUDIX family)